MRPKGRQNHALQRSNPYRTGKKKRMRPERPSGIVALRHQARKKHKPHEPYHPGHEIPPVSAHLCPEVRCKPCRPEVQQKPVLHLLPACPLRRFPAIPGLPVPASSQPPQATPRRSSSSSLICTEETPGCGLWDYGRGCGNEDIPTRLMLTYDSMAIQKNHLTLPHEFSVNLLKSPFQTPPFFSLYYEGSLRPFFRSHLHPLHNPPPNPKNYRRTRRRFIGDQREGCAKNRRGLADQCRKKRPGRCGKA